MFFLFFFWLFILLVGWLGVGLNGGLFFYVHLCLCLFVVCLLFVNFLDISSSGGGHPRMVLGTLLPWLGEGSQFHAWVSSKLHYEYYKPQLCKDV